MKKLQLLALCFIGLFISTSSYSQVLFLEDFDGIPGPGAGGAGTYTFAPGFMLRNVDNRTPAGAVSYVNEAWERREDFNFNVADSCAFSTSWYSPAGPADDWMWTPLIGPLPANAILSWNAVTYDPLYPDGYEVRVMTAASGPPTGGTGVLGNQVTNSTQIYSIAAENTAWINRQVSLNAYAGQSIYIAFRNNSNDQFLLLIDDIRVEVITNYDAQMLQVDTVTEYTLIPKTQVSALPLEGNIRNAGVSAITNVSMRVDVYNGSMTQIYTNTSSATPSLAPSTTTTLNAGTWTPPTTADVYTLKFYPVITETDQLASNDTITRTVVITDDTYARDDGTVVGSLGIGAGNGGFLGNEFAIYNPARLTDVGVYFTRGYTGARFAAVVWDMAAGYPNAIVAYTDTLTYPDDSADYYTMPMFGGEYLINPGNYVITMIEFDSTLAIGQTNTIFTDNRMWVDWPTNPIPTPWANNEDFGAGFSKPYVIRPTLLPPCPADIITGHVSTTAGCGSSDGTADVITTGTGPFSYSWTSGGTAVTETGLAAGDYVVTVIDTYSGCSETDSVTIVNSNAPIIDSVVTTDPLCFLGNTGTATAFVSGGTPGYTYSWSVGGTTATIGGLLAGSYTLTVTDTANCQSQSIITLTDPPEFMVFTSATDESCFGCNNGTATATPSGGTPGYTYIWSPSGGTNALATGLAPGSYQVVATDANGCSSTAPATVLAFVPNAIEDAIGLYKTQVFPNPSNGVFTLNGTFNYSGDVKIEIVNVLGEMIFNKVLGVDNEINTTIEINVKPGTYVLKITAGEYNTTKQLIIK